MWSLIEDVTLLILNLLDVVSIKAMMCTCKDFSEYDTEKVWRLYLIRNFGKVYLELPKYEGDPNEGLSMKKLCEKIESYINNHVRKFTYGCYDKYVYSLDLLGVYIECNKKNVMTYKTLVAEMVWQNIQLQTCRKTRDFACALTKLFISSDDHRHVLCMFEVGKMYNVKEIFDVISSNEVYKERIFTLDFFTWMLTRDFISDMLTIEYFLKVRPDLLEYPEARVAYKIFWNMLSVEEPTPLMITTARSLDCSHNFYLYALLERALVKKYDTEVLDCIWDMGYRASSSFLSNYHPSDSRLINWLRNKGVMV